MGAISSFGLFQMQLTTSRVPAYHGDEADEIGRDPLPPGEYRLPTGEHRLLTLEHGPPSGERDSPIHRATLVGTSSRPLAAAAIAAAAIAVVIEIGLFERAQ